MHIKKNAILLTLYLLALFVVSGCTIAPLSNTHSAHTTDKKSLAIQAGGTLNGEVPYARLAYGATKNLEIGALSEMQQGDVLVGLTAKYAFLNNTEKGMSLAVEGSLGGSGLSDYFYLGPVIGYKTKYWNGYMAARYNQVNDSLDDLSFDFSPLKIVHLSERRLKYGTLTLGSTIWLTKRLGLNVNGNYVFGPIEGVYAGAGLVYVFNKK